MALMRIAQTVYRRIRHSIELSRYNDFTIAEYFRKQGAVIGKDNRILPRTLGQEPYLINIGNHCTIAGNVSFLCHDGATWLFTEECPSLQKFGPIEIKDNCFIGINAMIMGNVKIGPNSIVGAGAVVTKDVPAEVIVAGNPARVVSTVDRFKEKAFRLWEQQRPQGYFAELEEGQSCSPADIQHMKNKYSAMLREHLIKRYKNTARL